MVWKNIPIGIFLFVGLSKAEKTRNKIIAAVAPIFNKKGYQGTAMSDIVLATGLTKGAIYGNFQNKEKLAEACFDHNVKFLQKGLFMAWASSASSTGKLEALLKFYTDNYETIAKNGGCPLMNAAVESDDFLPYFKDKAKTILYNWHSEIKSVVLNGQASGEINPDTDAVGFASSFIAMVEGGILVAKTADNPEHFFYVIENLKSLVRSQLKLKI